MAAHGFSKDHAPDLKQLIWILTVAGDGAVPLAHRVPDGDTKDSRTPIQTWERPCQLTGEELAQIAGAVGRVGSWPEGP